MHAYIDTYIHTHVTVCMCMYTCVRVGNAMLRYVTLYHAAIACRVMSSCDADLGDDNNDNNDDNYNNDNDNTTSNNYHNHNKHINNDNININNNHNNNNNNSNNNNNNNRKTLVMHAVFRPWPKSNRKRTRTRKVHNIRLTHKGENETWLQALGVITITIAITITTKRNTRLGDARGLQAVADEARRGAETGAARAFINKCVYIYIYTYIYIYITFIDSVIYTHYVSNILSVITMLIIILRTIINCY